jgi:DNA-binding beta-propeller fold protein YncE
MSLVPALPPEAVPIISGFDYVTVDSARKRVYAAHTGSQALLIADAETGAVIGQIRVGPLHGVAVDPASGHVYTGDGDGRTVSESDPVSKTVLRSVDVDGPVDAIAYDPALHRIYADEDEGTRVFVIDSRTMKQIGTVALPGHKPEYLAVDSQTHQVYQNIANLSEYVVIDPQTLKVVKVVKTPEIVNNHPLQFDSARGYVYVAGKNGVLSVYDRSGKKIASGSVQKGIDQCDLDAAHHRLACFGNSEVTLSDVSGAPKIVSRAPADPEVHTGAIDSATAKIWIVWPGDKGDFIQALIDKP